MRQRGIVTEVFDDGTAEVAVVRLSACSGCHKADPGMMTDLGDVPASACHECMIFPQDGELKVRAKNPCMARRGDRVLIETSTGQVLGYAYAVFLLPILVGAILGTLGGMYLGALWGYLLTAAGFLLVFLLVKLILDRFASRNTEYLIAGVL
ncbi:MAG: SoxR reducing system RseC family protein [Clostridia bacterium]|nr:SoxR reducing system RseC family protein [Clostridia bacterium]